MIDAPFALLDHRLGGRADAVERAPHRDVDRPLEAFHLGVDHQLAVAVDGVRDEPVELAEFLRRLGDQLFDRGLVGDVPLQQQGLAAELRGFLRRPAGRCRLRSGS